MKKTWIKVKRGILESKHIDKLGAAWYLYFYILDQADWETGTIKDWKDIYAADELGKPLGLIRTHRIKLVEEGYISLKKRQHDQVIIVHNWTDPRRYDNHLLNSKNESDEKSILSLEEENPQSFDNRSESENSQTQSMGQSMGQSILSPSQKNVPSYSHITHITGEHKDLNGIPSEITTLNFTEKDLKIWNQALGDLQERISKADFDSYVKNLSLIDVADSTFIVGAINKITAEIVQKRYGATLNGFLRGYCGHETKFEVVMR